jgi:ribonuclease HI
VSLTNLYLPAGGKHKEIADILNLVRDHIPVCDFNVAAGDFNFVLQVADHSPSRKWVRSNYYDVTEDLQEAWDNFAAKLGLSEVAQDQHTYHDIHLADLSQTTTARLDRIYTSHCQADFAVYEACCHIADVPYSVFSKYHLDDGNVLKSSNGKSSDHAPVGVHFIPTENTGTRGPRIPRWVAERPEFSQAFYEGWKPAAAHLHPEQCLADLKDDMYAASKRVLSNIKQQAKVVNQAHGKLAIATALLRLATRTPAPTLEIAKLLGKFPQLLELTLDGTPDIPAVKRYINQIVADASHEHMEDFDRQMMHRTFPLGDNEHDIISNPQRTRTTGAAERLKVWLPSLRRKIKRLRAARGAAGQRGEPTEDPDEMAKIAKDYWGKIWAKQPRFMRPSRATYLGQVRRIKEQLMPTIPSAHYVADIITGTNNSCAGPDGIPFEAYRRLVRAAAPVIHRLLQFFGSGGLPSADFNKGFLFLLPKKDTMLAADTRPISVTNADNRILAKVVVFAIGPALSDSDMGIHLDQKGGIAGRRGTDHVRKLSEKFYTAAEGGDTPYCLMFMDTRKAFDSVHHEFILAVLELFGLPLWVIRTIHALLHKVSVTPNFGKSTDIWIRIKRGVKQGCPLSPWIFAMCMDVLVRRLREIKGVDVYAYVDDIALGATNFRVFAKCMRVIDRFSQVSGLGINHDKTKGVCSQNDGRYEAWTASRHCPWQGDFKIVHEYVYLGFLTGKYVTAAGVYRAAFKKFRAKLAAYTGALRSFTPSKRFDVFNIFILPILSYLAPFYSLPAEGRVSHTTTKHLVRRALVSFGGSGYPYQQLIAPASELGFGNPVKDVWGYTVSVLVAEADLEPYRGLSNVLIEEKVSMRISKQRSHMAAEFVNWHLFVHTERGKPFPQVDPDDYKLPMAKRRKAIYQIMVRGALKCSHKHHVYYRDISKKLRARALPNSDVQMSQLKDNFALITSSVPNTARYHQVAMLHNAAATSYRVRRFSGATQDDLRCRACGAASDTIAHILGDDCVAAEARRMFGECIQYDLHHTSVGATSSWAAAFLLFRGGANRQQEVNAMVVFNYATWIAQVKDFRKCPTLPNRLNAAKTIVRTALSIWTRVRSCKWKLPHTLQGQVLQAPRKQGFGSSSNRTAEDKARAKAEAIRLVKAMAPEAAIGFTDGSAIPNPGPCGTGVVLYMPEHRHWLASAHDPALPNTTDTNQNAAPAKSPSEDEGLATGPLAAFTGLVNEGEASEGSNNIAEMWGPAMLIQLLEWHERKTGKRHSGPIAIFIDSQLALTIDIIRYKARPKLNSRLAHAVRRLVTRRNQTNSVYIALYWLAGHADIVENDMVDGCAKRGARMARDRPGDCMDIEHSITSECFLPPGQAPFNYHTLPP